jgi:MerR family transcriptional regulator, light-induced transcriptional regulator
VSDTTPRGARTKALSIGALSRATGIPAETLRTWERRYGSPKPLRKPSGHRLYPALAAERLRRVARLLVQGYRPAEILTLTVPQLDALLTLSDPATERKPGTPEHPMGSAGSERVVDSLTQAATRFDRESLMRDLRAAWGRLGPLRFLEEVSGPFMTRIGADWEAGRMEIRHEHFASACLSDFLREVREPFDEEAKGPRVAAALLTGDEHEGGLLMASALLAIRGYRVIYLGANTPTEQIVATAATGGVEAVVISVSAGVSRARAEQELTRLRKALPHRIPLWIGGARAPATIPRAERFATLSAFGAHLGSRVT